jgi:hypothetical protein
MTRKLVLLALALGACGKSDQGSSATQKDPPGAAARGGCPTLEVTVDGVKVEGLGHPVAIIAENAGYRTPMVKYFNHDKMTCAKALTGQDLGTEGELVVRAWSGQAPGVGIEAWTQLESASSVTVESTTEKVGEPMTLCVPKPIVFTPSAGAYSGKKVSIVGRFSASFCGVWKS